jgi:hypothetical protein
MNLIQCVAVLVTYRGSLQVRTHAAAISVHSAVHSTLSISGCVGGSNIIVLHFMCFAWRANRVAACFSSNVIVCICTIDWLQHVPISPCQAC